MHRCAALTFLRYTSRAKQTRVDQKFRDYAHNKQRKTLQGNVSVTDWPTETEREFNTGVYWKSMSDSRKQVSNGYDETSTDDEQIRPELSYGSRRLWMEPLRGILDE